MNMLHTLALCAALATPAEPQDRPTVACTIPILETLAREVGGDDFEYFSLSKADQDPHRVRATPVLQRKLRKADLFIEVGLQLELWADLVANRAGRARLQRGQAGRVVASRGIPREQIPSALTRAAGHIHPDGNPHLWLDPVRAIRMAANIAAAFKKTLPARADAIDARLAAFRKRVHEAHFGKELLDLVGAKELERRSLDGTLHAYLAKEELDGKKLAAYAGGWLKKAVALRGIKVVEFHQNWIYMSKALGFEIVATIEEKPGIPPGPRYQVELTRRIREESIKLIIVDNFFNPDLPRTISGDTGVPTVIVPNQPGGEEGTGDYFSFIDHVIGKLAGGLK